MVVFISPHTPIQPLLLYDSSCIALCCQSVAAVSNFSFLFKLLELLCPHVPVCLNLVYNKAEEMCETAEACLSFLFVSFWFVNISKQFISRYECFLKNRKKARILSPPPLHLSVLSRIVLTRKLTCDPFL